MGIAVEGEIQGFVLPVEEAQEAKVIVTTAVFGAVSPADQEVEEEGQTQEVAVTEYDEGMISVTSSQLEAACSSANIDTIVAHLPTEPFYEMSRAGRSANEADIDRVSLMTDIQLLKATFEARREDVLQYLQCVQEKKLDNPEAPIKRDIRGKPFKSGERVINSWITSAPQELLLEGNEKAVRWEMSGRRVDEYMKFVEKKHPEHIRWAEKGTMKLHDLNELLDSVFLARFGVTFEGKGTFSSPYDHIHRGTRTWKRSCPFEPFERVASNPSSKKSIVAPVEEESEEAPEIDTSSRVPKKRDLKAEIKERAREEKEELVKESLEKGLKAGMSEAVI
jgi:hypothetical protein